MSHIEPESDVNRSASVPVDASVYASVVRVRELEFELELKRADARELAERARHQRKRLLHAVVGSVALLSVLQGAAWWQQSQVQGDLRAVQVELERTRTQTSATRAEIDVLTRLVAERQAFKQQAARRLAELQQLIDTLAVDGG